MVAPLHPAITGNDPWSLYLNACRINRLQWPRLFFVLVMGQIMADWLSPDASVRIDDPADGSGPDSK
jgi:hypothetical protein